MATSLEILPKLLWSKFYLLTGFKDIVFQKTMNFVEK
jgi:hypothetical protein